MGVMTSGQLLAYLGKFVAVLLLLLVTLWLLKRLQRNVGGAVAGRRIEVLESVSIGVRQKLLLVRVDQTEVLVGVAQGQLVTLESWQRPDEGLGTVPSQAHAQRKGDRFKTLLGARP